MLNLEDMNRPGAPFARRAAGMGKRSALLFSIALLLPLLARADQYTGLPEDDPKELLPLRSAPGSSSGTVGFLPLPNWAHVTTLPPLPNVLKPYGNKTPVATAATPTGATPPPLAPPKETAPVPTPVTVTTVTTTAQPPATPAPTNSNDSTMVTVSPFLQWIKANPQAAAEQARQQAGNYNATAPVTPTPGAPGGNVPPPQDTYWLPPMLESTPSDSQTPGSSAAIYSTPQR